MSIYILAKKAKMRENTRAYNALNPFSLSRTNTGRVKSGCRFSNQTAPIVQTGYGIRNKQLTTTKCGCKVVKKMPDTTTKQYMDEKRGDHIYTANNTVAEKKSSNVNCSTSASGSSGKSLNSNINRLKRCVVTKPPPVARTAAQQIEKKKAAISTCPDANPKPIVNSRCRTTG